MILLNTHCSEELQLYLPNEKKKKVYIRRWFIISQAQLLKKKLMGNYSLLLFVLWQKAIQTAHHSLEFLFNFKPIVDWYGGDIMRSGISITGQSRHSRLPYQKKAPFILKQCLGTFSQIVKHKSTSLTRNERILQSHKVCVCALRVEQT